MCVSVGEGGRSAVRMLSHRQMLQNDSTLLPCCSADKLRRPRIPAAPSLAARCQWAASAIQIPPAIHATEQRQSQPAAAAFQKAWRLLTTPKATVPKCHCRCAKRCAWKQNVFKPDRRVSFVWTLSDCLGRSQAATTPNLIQLQYMPSRLASHAPDNNTKRRTLCHYTLHNSSCLTMVPRRRICDPVHLGARRPQSTIGSPRDQTRSSSAWHSSRGMWCCTDLFSGADFLVCPGTVRNRSVAQWCPLHGDGWTPQIPGLVAHKY